MHTVVQYSLVALALEYGLKAVLKYVHMPCATIHGINNKTLQLIG